MVDTAILASWVIPMDDEPTVLHDHVILIDGNEIKAIVPRVEAEYYLKSKISVIELGNHIVLPGLINLHGHSAMTLLRGLADDLALMDWLNHHIWPAEGKHVGAKFVYDGSLLAMGEMIKGGTTTINDMYFFHAAVAAAGLKMGMRTFVGCSILEFPTNYAPDAEQYLSKIWPEKAVFDGEDLIQFVLAPHAPYTVSDQTFRKVVDYAEKENMLIHCHIHETRDEISGSLKEYGMRPLARLDQLGMLHPRLTAAHMVHLNDDEIELIAKRGVNVAHNPASNMKLASGFAPIQKLLNAGVNVGLGTDGAASNNKLDMFADMRLAALIAKGHSENPSDLSAYQALKMATILGARALNMGDKIGSVHPGKRADLIAVDVNQIQTSPIFDPISHLVYAADRQQVSHVWVNGELLLNNRELTQVDENNLLAIAHQWQRKIQTP